MLFTCVPKSVVSDLVTIRGPKRRERRRRAADSLSSEDDDEEDDDKEEEEGVGRESISGAEERYRHIAWVVFMP